MAPCEIVNARLFSYLDGELGGSEATELERHLTTCPSCQLAAAGRRRFLDGISAARPVLSVPAELHRRIEGILAGAPPANRTAIKSVAGFIERAMGVLAGARWASPRTAFALATLVVVLGSVWLEHTTGPRSSFAAAALAAHKQHLNGEIPLGIRSSSAEAVSAWLQGRVAVHVSLPRNDELPQESQPYQIEGGGVVPVGGGVLGYVAYRVRGRPVSLFIAPASAVTLAGRKQVPMKALLIHYDSAGGFHIVTWAVPRKGITYALVSDRHEHPNQSCIVCHAGAKDRGFMQALLSQ